MSENEANWINLLGLGSNLQKVIDGWAGLVDTDELRDVPPPRLLPLSPAMTAVVESGEDVVRVGHIEHAPDQGRALVERLNREIPTQLGLAGDDVALLTGFFLEPASGE